MRAKASDAFTAACSQPKAAEGGGWFCTFIETIAYLDRLSMRAFGYSALVLRLLGVVPYELPAPDTP
jgi:TRAP-type mannitol/chloroaromatic compound transport system substrate-binding protein